jgi:geranylgeranyl pyrophosphate synthase
MSLDEWNTLCQQRLQILFDHYLKKTTYVAATLQTAMYYSLANGGKRIRPLLVYLTGQANGTPLEQLDAPAFAVELIHTFSLIHDD